MSLSSLPSPPSGKYPAKLHASKVLAALKPSLKAGRHVLFLAGKSIETRDDSDHELAFHQEANFFYLSGSRDVPGARLVVDYELGKEDGAQTRLFVPEVDKDSVMWSGLPPSHDQIRSKTDVDSIEELPALDKFISSLPSSTTVHHLPFTPSPTPGSTSSHLLPALHLARRTKTPYEVELMRYANLISSRAHEHLMSLSSPSLSSSQPFPSSISTESEGLAAFHAFCTARGAKEQAYGSIVAVGPNGGTLHYLGNDQPFFQAREGEAKGRSVLVDAGCEWQGYASDITRVFPVGNGGKWTEEGKGVYKAVLEMQQAALDAIKPGVEWEDIQLLMHRVAAKGLVELGILVSPSGSTDRDALITELLEKNITVGFFPHGVGHMLGLDTHDVGGLPNGRSSDPKARYLRLRLPLGEGFVVTVEPGLYFNEHLLKDVRRSGYVDEKVLARFMDVGGVRIEDNVLVTQDGYENFTTAVKEVEDVETLCTGGGK